MKRLALAAIALVALAASAGAQVIPPGTNPVPGGGAYNSSPPTCVAGSACWFQVDVNGNLKITGTVTSSLSGSTSNATSGVATSATNIPTVAYNYVWNGTTWDQSTGLVVGTLGVPSTQYVSVQGPASNGGFPTASTPINGNATGSTGAVVGTLAGVASKTTYICGFSISATGGVATLGPIVIAGLVTASQTYQLFSTATGANLSVPFSPCIPASATNTAITITTTADATASAVDVNSWGYQQ